MKSQYKVIILASGVIAVLVAGAVGTQLLRGQNKPSRGTTTLAITQPISVLRAEDYHSLAFSTNDSNVIFFGHHSGIMRSGDSGNTWQSLLYSANFDAMSLAIDYSDSQRMYLAGHNIFQTSRDGGVTWSPIQTNLPGTDIHGFAVNPDDPHSFFVLIYKEGFFHSNDYGLTWEKVSTQLPVDVMAIAASGDTSGTLYAASMMTGIYKSTDGGHSWISAGKISGSNDLMSLAVDAKTPTTVYAGGGSGLYKSMDGGDSWTKLPFPGSNVAALAISPTQPGLFVAIAVAHEDGEVYRSKDGGMTWGD